MNSPCVREPTQTSPSELSNTQVTSMTGRCTAADVHYLAQAKGGPFEVRAELLSRHDHQVSFRVTITDVGHDDRLLSVATTTTIPA